MQIPKRRLEKLKKRDDGPVHLTAAGVAKLERQLEELELGLPSLIKEVVRTKEYGDFSENAEYKEAKHKLRQAHARIFSIKDRLGRAEVISERPNTSGQVGLGSKVVVEVNGRQKTYQIVGPHESDPSGERISHLSPLGELLIGKPVGEAVKLETRSGSVVYRIIKVQ